MKNENIENLEIEDLIRTKMNELSDSVDCFDRISAQAFPQEEQDFSEDGFTVSGLENITGRKHKPHLIKWTALVAAAVVCVAVIPKTGFVRRVFSNIGTGSVKKSYQQLITDINTELENSDYRIIDVPLDYYIDNDVLITPLFSCPFEDCGKENTNVRLFIKQIDGYDSTQVYAALYSGSYMENNIIAAAESNYRFTENDTNEYVPAKRFTESSETAVRTYFGINEQGQFVDEGKTAVVASFEEPSIIMTDNGAKLVTSEIIYGKYSDSGYFYDIYTTGDTADHRATEKIEMPSRDEMWKRSIYFNGNSAFPADKTSGMTKTDIYEKALFMNYEGPFAKYVYPYDIDVNSLNIREELTVRANNGSSYSGSVMTPMLPENLMTFRIFYSAATNDDGKNVYNDIIIKDKSNNTVCTSKDRNETVLENETLQRHGYAIKTYSSSSIDENDRKMQETAAEAEAEQRLMEEVEKVESERRAKVESERRALEAQEQTS